MELLIGAVAFVITQFFKKYIEPKFGKEGTIIFVFFLALIGATAWFFIQKMVPEQYIKNIVEIGLVAIGWYELIWKRIFNKSTK